MPKREARTTSRICLFPSAKPFCFGVYVQEFWCQIPCWFRNFPKDVSTNSIDFLPILTAHHTMKFLKCYTNIIFFVKQRHPRHPCTFINKCNIITNFRKRRNFCWFLYIRMYNCKGLNFYLNLVNKEHDGFWSVHKYYKANLNHLKLNKKNMQL